MADIHHFSHHHPHPLTSFLNKEADDDDIENQKYYLCSICGLPILSSPSYTCSVDGCNFFLHEPCAELPEELSNPRWHRVGYGGHDLNLRQKSNSQHFIYECDMCDFNIHPLLVVRGEIKSTHRSHRSHPLVAICRETSSLCDACGEEHKGFFFSRQECNFWIHQDCAALPSILKLASHHHPFILTYSLSYCDESLAPNCIICRNPLFPKVGVYFCGQCYSYAHVGCSKSNMENLKSETRPEWIQLLADEGDIFPSLVIRTYLESSPDDNKLPIEKYHKHLLKFHDNGFCSNSREACNFVCDLCVQPINVSSDPFYRCLQPDCHFLAHNICANHLPSSYILSDAETHIKAYLSPSPSESFFNSVFPCFGCHRPCNGFCYYDDYDRFLTFLDLECMTAPISIKHKSHGQHVLSNIVRRDLETVPLRCCSSDSFFYDVYRCIVCDDFSIHLRCALLPKRTRHKFDEHPLELITPLWKAEDQNEQKCCFCEFCEEDIDQKYWYYGCGECEQYFHINCIPSVGYLSKVKFGGTLYDNNFHSHPLTLTRMLTIGRHERCGYCKKIIKGFVDEMAFHCSDCYFWIHFSCAKDSSSTPLRLYSEVQKEIEDSLDD